MPLDVRYSKTIHTIRIRRATSKTWNVTCFNRTAQVLWHGTVQSGLSDLYERMRYIAPNRIWLWWHDSYITLYDVREDKDGQSRAIPE